jgi:high-affinity iron transporter
MEAVVFVGGVSLGQPAASIPIAAIVGIICGLVVGFVIYEFASRTSKPNPRSQKKKKILKKHKQL